jgi:hypothetical protein
VRPKRRSGHNKPIVRRQWLCGVSNPYWHIRSNDKSSPVLIADLCPWGWCGHFLVQYVPTNDDPPKNGRIGESSTFGMRPICHFQPERAANPGLFLPARQRPRHGEKAVGCVPFFGKGSTEKNRNSVCCQIPIAKVGEGKKDRQPFPIEGIRHNQCSGMIASLAPLSYQRRADVAAQVKSPNSVFFLLQRSSTRTKVFIVAMECWVPPARTMLSGRPAIHPAIGKDASRFMESFIRRLNAIVTSRPWPLY